MAARKLSIDVDVRHLQASVYASSIQDHAVHDWINIGSSCGIMVSITTRDTVIHPEFQQCKDAVMREFNQLLNEGIGE